VNAPESFFLGLSEQQTHVALPWPIQDDLISQTSSSTHGKLVAFDAMTTTRHEADFK